MERMAVLGDIAARDLAFPVNPDFYRLLTPT